jgi:membrane associated rhomboid family serine protease
MYFLYLVGDNVEDALGSRNYLLFYLTCGILANIVFMFASWGSNVPVLGASGAIAGVMAAYLLLFRRARLTAMLFFWQVKVVAWLWLGSWLLFNLFSALLMMNERAEPIGVAWWAHVGGFLAGLLLIWPLEKRIVHNYPLLQVMRTQGTPPKLFQWI